jgi:hypothetical protein
VFLLILAPVGFLIGTGEASAAIVSPTTYTYTGTVTTPQNFGNEGFGVAFDSTLVGDQASDYAEGTVTINAIGPSPATTVTTLCSSTWLTGNTAGADDPEATPTAPQTANYYCTGAGGASLLAPGTYTVESNLTAAVGGLVGFAYANSTSTTTQTVVINKAPTTLNSTTLTNFADTVTYPETATNIPAGSALTDTASISGLEGTTGDVAFAVYASGNCTGSIITSGSEAATSSTAFDFNAPATTATVFSVLVTYPGSGDDAAAAGSPECEGPFTTTLATTSISTVATTTAAIGSPISDTVTLSGLSGTNATGSVTITAQVGSCTGAGVFSTVILLNSSEITGTTATVSGQFTPIPPPASYFWSVAYSGDTNNSPFTEACGGTDEESTVGTANSSTLTQVIVDSTGNPPTGNEVAGTSYHDTATVSGAITPTGTVTYDFYDNSSCSGSYATTQTVTIAGGLVPNSATTGPLGAGSYSYCVSYSGDLNNAPSSAAHESFSVYPASTTLSITTSRLPSGNHGRAYSAAIATSGGTAPLHFSLSAVGSGQRVPPGLSINPTTGVISGVAGATGTYIFTVTVTDSTLPTHQTVSKTLSITIS